MYFYALKTLRLQYICSFIQCIYKPSIYLSIYLVRMSVNKILKCIKCIINVQIMYEFYTNRDKSM